MHATDDWYMHAGSNMGQAQHTSKKAGKQNDVSFTSHADTVNSNLYHYGEVHGTLQQKVRTSYRIIEVLQRRANSIENSIQHCMHSYSQLDATHRSIDPQMQLTMWRLEQREGRPLREQINDGPELQLEAEKDLLMDTQQKLSDAMKRTRNTIHELEGKLKEVRHDIEHKTQALGIDETCLRTTQKSFALMAERSRPFSNPPGRPGGALKSLNSKTPFALSESARNETLRQQEAARLNVSAAAREEAAKALRDDNKSLMGRLRKGAEEMHQRTERTLQERISESQVMRKRLEDELAGTNHKINQTKHTIQETRAQIKSLEEPMECTSTCASYRQQRATREHIVDPVTTKLSEHQQMVLEAIKELEDHNEQEKNNLRELSERRDRLKDDLQDKTSAMHVDLNCLTHQAEHRHGKPQSFLSLPRLSIANTVEPGFVPMPGAPAMQLPHTSR